MRGKNKQLVSTRLWIGFGVALLAGVQLRFLSSLTLSNFYIGSSSNNSSDDRKQEQYPQRRIKVFSADSNHPNARQLRQDIAALNRTMEHLVLTTSQQRAFLKSACRVCGNAAVKRFDDFLRVHQGQLALQIWYYCALYLHGGVLLDSSSSSMMLVPLDNLIRPRNVSMAVLNDPHLFPNSLHGSFLYLSQPYSSVSKGMLQVLLTTPILKLETTPLLLPQSLYRLVQLELGQHHESIRHPGRNSKQHAWQFLQQTCNVNLVRVMPVTKRSKQKNNASRAHYMCPPDSGFCCHVYDPEMSAVVAATRLSLLPYQMLPSLDKLPKPYNSTGAYDIDDLPYISTIQDRLLSRSNRRFRTINQSSAFDILSRRNCLPSKECVDCFRGTNQTNACKNCHELCGCYCKTLCRISVPRKRVNKEVIVQPPLYRRDPSRLIPRIIHQTWYEQINTDRYPSSGRFVESFQHSGWEYRFYTDEQAAAFLSTHFPPEVRQAYDSLLPGAFKADLFRYCVLLVHGGLYADVDVLLESNPDAVVGPDVGFLAPIDSAPGLSINLRMCVWNGFMAAAPGHPFLAKAIELVVNNARNRFNTVDHDYAFCPNPELSILHEFDMLFVAGPCLLGAAMNQVLGRPRQTQFDVGEVSPAAKSKMAVPGRTIILNCSKEDVGGHRFTLEEKGLIVAATDFPESKDLVHPVLKHYGSVETFPGLYGVNGLYSDKDRANEELRFHVSSG